MSLILVTGGIRSGKSVFAETLSSGRGHSVLYAATGVCCDREMEERIRKHQERRPADWGLVECPYELVGLNSLSGQGYDVILLDCLSGWISNRLLRTPEDKGRDPQVTAELFAHLESWLAHAQQAPSTVVVVTNEAGWGGVAMSRLGRWFQDVLGEANQKAAERSEQVYAVMSGIAWRIKG